MTRISNNLLSDTLYLIQLARETALAKGNAKQAERLGPVVKNFQEVVTKTETHKVSGTAKPTGIMGQSDFKQMLEKSQAAQQKPEVVNSSSWADRSQVVRSMASANMPEMDIARQMGMTIDEVRLIVSFTPKTGGSR
jgi:predicted RND superfamily exporter protein